MERGKNEHRRRSGNPKDTALKNMDNLSRSKKEKGRTAEERTKRTSALYGSFSGKSIEL